MKRHSSNSDSRDWIVSELQLWLVVAVSIALPCIGVAADLGGWLIP